MKSTLSLEHHAPLVMLVVLVDGDLTALDRLNIVKRFNKVCKTDKDFDQFFRWISRRYAPVIKHKFGQLWWTQEDYDDTRAIDAAGHAAKN